MSNVEAAKSKLEQLRSAIRESRENAVRHGEILRSNFDEADSYVEKAIELANNGDMTAARNLYIETRSLYAMACRELASFEQLNAQIGSVLLESPEDERTPPAESPNEAEAVDRPEALVTTLGRTDHVVKTWL